MHWSGTHPDRNARPRGTGCGSWAGASGGWERVGATAVGCVGGLGARLVADASYATCRLAAKSPMSCVRMPGGERPGSLPRSPSVLAPRLPQLGGGSLRACPRVHPAPHRCGKCVAKRSSPPRRVRQRHPAPPERGGRRRRAGRACHACAMRRPSRAANRTPTSAPAPGCVNPPRSARPRRVGPRVAQHPSPPRPRLAVHAAARSGSRRRGRAGDVQSSSRRRRPRGRRRPSG